MVFLHFLAYRTVYQVPDLRTSCFVAGVAIKKVKIRRQVRCPRCGYSIVLKGKKSCPMCPKVGRKPFNFAKGSKS